MPRIHYIGPFTVLLLALAVGQALAEVGSSGSAQATLDTRPPRLEVLAPPPNSLYLAGDPIFFEWRCEEPNPDPGALYNEAVVYASDDSIAGRHFAAADSTFQWAWVAPELPPSQTILRVTARDAWGNTAEAASEWFTILPAGSGTEPTPQRRFALLPAAPNPFNPQTRIRFELDRAGPVALDVYDARGRHVRTLRRGLLEAGSHEEVWDGTDDGQRRVAGGLYLVRLNRGDGTPHEACVRKVVLAP